MAQAGNDRLTEVKKLSASKKGQPDWCRYRPRFTQLALINPRFGSGENKIGFGGLGNLFANYKRDKIYWNNAASMQFAVQQIGISSNPFLKNLDRFVFGSKIGYKFNDKWAAALDANLETQLTPTYQGNILKPTKGESIVAN
ncbi:hypothetical protein MASR1M65_19510 [Saprospiraceae bacterium]